MSKTPFMSKIAGEFKDHFSTQSKDYGKFRPQYPLALYEHLASICDSHDLAWDCATGTGQAARGVAKYFNRIVATDGSKKQILNAKGPNNVFYSVATAENSGLSDSSVDLITVAQALHWFSHEAFFKEAERVLKPRGLLAVWTYDLIKIDEGIDPILDRFNEDIVGQYWPPERQLVRDRYRGIDFPFEEISLPAFKMEAMWDLDGLFGYLRTWSSVVRYRADKGHDPLEDIYDDILKAWGVATDKKHISWPLSFRIGRRLSPLG